MNIKNQTKNETEIQLMKILFKTGGRKATKNITSKRAYPYGVEAKFYRQLKSFFKPLTNYVNKYINENLEPLLRGDSDNVRLDTIPGSSYRGMVYNLEEWLTAYMPDISEIKNLSNNIILTSLGKTADEAMDFETAQFQKTIEKGIHINLPTSAEWWNDMKSSWAEDNYTLITSNAKKFVTEINTLTEQAIVNGMSPAKLKSQIKKATEGLSDKHCKLLARDQMGKLNGQITQAQMEEIDLEMYVWDTSMDDRVRESHQLMQGLLCRWDDASVCSYDNGKTWVDRPSGAVLLHPGQDIQCRCVALAFYPELEAEMTGTSLSEQTEELPPVQDIFAPISEDRKLEAVEETFKNIKDYLTQNEQDSISKYTSGDYFDINKMLRNISDKSLQNTENEQVVKNIKNSISKSKTMDFDITVYRGTRKFSEMENWKVGDEIIFHGFTSTTLKKEDAFNGNVFMEINIPKNKKAGIFVKEFSQVSFENEFLINDGSRLKLKSIEQIGDPNKPIDRHKKSYAYKYIFDFIK